jgi:hypothetical protein
MSSVDYLTEDTFLPEDQKFVCISFLSDPENKVSLKGVKIRGVFSELEKASEHAKKIQSIDKFHNVFVGEMGKWLAFEPDINSEAAGNPEYANEQLNGIMKGYMQNQEKSKIFHEQRKYEQLRKSLGETIENQNENMKELQQNILEEQDDEKVKSLTEKLDLIKTQIKELEEKRADYSKKEKKLQEKIDSDSKLSNAVSTEV